MTGKQLKRYRRENKLSQHETAVGLGISQSYLSLVEAGERPLTARLQRKAAKFLKLPLEMPTVLSSGKLRMLSDDQLASDLADLGYSGFAHLSRKRSRRMNPADVLLSGLSSPKRDARLVEALPWLVLNFWNMNWTEVTLTAKIYDLQNRLGYVTTVARRVAERNGRSETVSLLKKQEGELQRSMLAREDTLCNETMTRAERNWLRTHRPEEAKQWRLLTDLSPQHLPYA
jgi:transcriptional regulator with XRE-family HTH domain